MFVCIMRPTPNSTRVDTPLHYSALFVSSVAAPGRQDTAHLAVVRVVASAEKKPRQRRAEAASRPGDADSRPWMACGGSSGMDACRAGEHAPVGTTLLPKPVHRVWRSRRIPVTEMLAVTGERAWNTARNRRDHHAHTEAEHRRTGAVRGAVAGGAVRHTAVRGGAA